MTFFNQISQFILKNPCILFICLGIPTISFAQELEWVYTIPSVMGENDGSRSSYVRNIVTNSNNEVYVIGGHVGTHDFGNQIYTAEVLGNYRSSIVKLDENKNVLWVRKIPTSTLSLLSNPEGIKLALDTDGNLLIGGMFQQTTLAPVSFNPDYHPAFNPVNVYENLTHNTYYGVVLKLDGQDGHYIDDILFENIVIEDIEVDSNNDIVVVGATTEFDLPIHFNKWFRAYICKLDSNLNLIWDKTYNNSGNPNAIFAVGLDSQNNIYCQGTYLDNFTFGGVTLQNPSSEFICKLLPNGNESWINELNSNPFVHYSTSAPIIFNRKIHTDTSDNLYFFSTYSEAPSYQFNNTVIGNLPPVSGFSENSVFFRMDVNGNHIWNIPLYGTGNQNIIDFNTNNSGELISVVNSSSQSLHYADNIVLETNGEESFLLKSNPAGELIDFKRLDINPRAIEIDTDNNILLGGRFREMADFDPHPFNEYILYTDSYIFNGNMTYENVAFVLKLSPCDVETLFLDSYDFCYEDTPTATIGDIVPNDFNISWYSSMSSQTPLADDFLITDGATYYMEKIAENCPTLIRQPVQMNFLPPLAPPVFDSVQPCYFQGMKLSDLNISGENLTFYSSLHGDSPIEDSTVILTNITYYVTQTVGKCESERVTINVGNLELITRSHTVSICDNGKDDTETVNLSDYVPFFVSSLNGFSVSYHTSYDDAFNGVNPVANYQNYQTGNQTVYIRFYSAEFGCFETVELTINLSLPPEIIQIKINDLSDNNSITVLPYNENYLYSMNGITYQNNNYFDNLQGGEYLVFVKDKDESCQPVTDSVFLLSYPKFFTPNGDGINDYWKIQLSEYQELLNVEIYDRYGKLIAFFDKDSPGWDGTLNGKNLPATDYWFKITRISDQKIISRGHFALVR